MGNIDNQFQQKMSVGVSNDGMVKTNNLVGPDMSPLDISSGLTKESKGGPMRNKEERVLALNKKLVKPLTGNKKSQQSSINNSNNFSQQNLVFAGP